MFTAGGMEKNRFGSATSETLSPAPGIYLECLRDVGGSFMIEIAGLFMLVHRVIHYT